jgi:hypothetical protein
MTRQYDVDKDGRFLINTVASDVGTFSRGAQMEFEVLTRKELVSPVSPPVVESPMTVPVGSPVFVAQT